MTDLIVNLSGTLQAELAKPGVDAYAVWFDSTQTIPQWTTLVSDGTIEKSGAIAGQETIALPSTMTGGKVYFIIQSQNPSAPIQNLTTLITDQSDINFSNATALDFGYDSFEVTLSSTSSDVGNLSSVNGFGLPMEVSVPYDNGTTATVGYGISGTSLADEIKNINPAAVAIYNFTTGALADDFRMALSPTVAVTPGETLTSPVPFSDTNWAGYISNLETSLAGGSPPDIVLSGEFNGAPSIENGNSVWHNGGYFAYQLSWDGTNFWLDALSTSQIQGDIQISPTELGESIYSTLGTVNIYQNGSVYLAGMNTGANNQWGKVLSEFLTGFTGGYYETSGKSLNPQIHGTIDLNQNLNWDPIYAFGQNLAAPPPTAYQTDDPYSKIFYANSNSYGSGYSDALMSEYAVGGPQISVAQPGSSVDVPAINLTIFADGETPSPDTAHGYTPPEIYNYISVTAPDYYTAPTNSSNDASIGLSFASSVANNAGVVLAGTASISFAILTSDTGGIPVWDTITLDGATAGTLGLWQKWTISGTPGHYIATASPNSEPVGSLLLADVPTGNGGVSWYEIGVGGKTFNLYTTNSANGLFENPKYNPNNVLTQPGALAIDGLASLAPPITPGVSEQPQTIDTFTVDFTTSSAVTFNPSLLTPNTANFGVVTPNAPVAGIIAGNSIDALAGQTLQVSNTITTSDQDIAFAWTGENNAPGSGTVSWISGYTNLIDANDIARITIKPSQGTPITTTATADIDGQWRTGAVDLAPGTYTVTMQEFLPGDTLYAHPLTNPSSPLVLTEEPSDDIPCFLAGTMIRTIAGDRPVESLAVGDLVTTRDGEAKRLTWIGMGKVLATPNRRTAATPIIVRKGALADNVPDRDLYITKGHSLHLDGALIPAEFLINHRTILWDDRAGEVEFYHLELATHDVLLANNAPAESYRDDDNRWLFRNANTGWGQPPKPACAPVLTGGPVVDAVWRRLLDRSGYRRTPTTTAPDLHLVVDGTRVNGRDLGNGRHAFQLPHAPRRVCVRSRAAAPDVLGLARDPRRLGVALRRITLWDGPRLKLLEASDAALSDGFHEFETDNGLRWTDGDGVLPPAWLAGVPAGCTLELQVAATTNYPAVDSEVHAA